MDLAEIAAQFDDDRMQKAALQLAEACDEVPVQGHDTINRDVAKTVNEWTKIMQKPKTTVYARLRELVDAGEWKRCVAKDPNVSGRPMHYYYPAGMNPEL